MKEIQIDSRVRMSSTTQYSKNKYNPRNCEGSVTDIYEEPHRTQYSVDWDNGHHNGSYYITDIELVDAVINSSYSIF
jgi:hypothetical protein